MTPHVSILIPTCNRASYLQAAVESAREQTHPSLEIVILDDASTDETPAVCAAFGMDPRVRVVRHPKNLGIARNWQVGVETARGEFFCLLHDDDTLEPEFVETLLRPLLAEPALVLSFCDHWVMDARGERLTEESDAASRRFHRDVLPPGLLVDFGHAALVEASLPVGATLFRRSAVTSDMISERARGAIDLWLFLGCVKTGGGAFYVPRRLMNYRQHAGGMSASLPLYMAEGHLFRYKQILSDETLVRLHSAVRQQMALTLTNAGVDLLASGDARRARRSLWQALRIRPSARGLVTLGLACSGAGTRAARAIRAGRRP